MALFCHQKLDQTISSVHLLPATTTTGSRHGHIRTDCVTIFLNVVATGGTVRWNRHITPDLCLATSWLHDLIYGI
jgi:hypothetical protein